MRYKNVMGQYSTYKTWFCLLLCYIGHKNSDVDQRESVKDIKEAKAIVVNCCNAQVATALKRSLSHTENNACSNTRLHESTTSTTLLLYAHFC